MKWSHILIMEKQTRFFQVSIYAIMVATGDISTSQVRESCQVHTLERLTCSSLGFLSSTFPKTFHFLAPRAFLLLYFLSFSESSPLFFHKASYWKMKSLTRSHSVFYFCSSTHVPLCPKAIISENSYYYIVLKLYLFF